MRLSGARRERPAACWRPGRSGFGPRTWRCAHGWAPGGATVRTGGGPDGSAEDRASEHRRSQGQGLGGPGPGGSVKPHEVAPSRGPARPGRPAGGAGHHPRAGPGAGPPWPDDGLAVHLLPGRGRRSWRRISPTTPVAGLEAQLCGDAHLSNFGAFASPERVLLFDLNDFDETLPGPFEYDVKRMAASFTIAARNNGFSKVNAQAATLASVRAYREAMAGFAQMPTMDIWYAHLDEDELRAGIRTLVAGTAKQEKAAKKQEKADKREKAPKKQEKRAAKQEKADREEEKAAKTAEKRADKDPGEGAHPRQPAGAVQARRAGRRHLPDRQPAADRGPSARPGRHLRPVPGPGRAGAPRTVPRLPGHPAGRPAPPAGAVRDRGRGPQGRRRRQRRDPGVHRPAPGTRRPGPAVPADQGGDGIGSRALRRARAATGSTASGWCRGSG